MTNTIKQNFAIYIYIYIKTWGRRVIGISGYLIWSKNMMEVIYSSEFRWSPKGPLCQIHSPHLHIGAPGNFSCLLMSVQMLKREWGAGSNGKLPHLFIRNKTSTFFQRLRCKTCLSVEVALVPEFTVKDLPFGRPFRCWYMVKSEVNYFGKKLVLLKICFHYLFEH